MQFGWPRRGEVRVKMGARFRKSRAASYLDRHGSAPEQSDTDIEDEVTADSGTAYPNPRGDRRVALRL